MAFLCAGQGRWEKFCGGGVVRAPLPGCSRERGSRGRALTLLAQNQAKKFLSKFPP